MSRKTLEGWIIVDRNEQNAWVVLMLPDKPVNHVLHAILTIVTCLLWGIIWAIMAGNHQKEQRMRITIEPSGFLLEGK